MFATIRRAKKLNTTKLEYISGVTATASWFFIQCSVHAGTRQFKATPKQVRASDEASPTQVKIGDAVYNGMGESFSKEWKVP